MRLLLLRATAPFSRASRWDGTGRMTEQLRRQGVHDNGAWSPSIPKVLVSLSVCVCVCVSRLLPV